MNRAATNHRRRRRAARIIGRKRPLPFFHDYASRELPQVGAHYIPAFAILLLASLQD